MLSIFSLQSANRALSDSCGNYSSTTAGYNDITNLSVSIRASGNRPIVICLVPDGSGNECYFGCDDTTGVFSRFPAEILRGSDLITNPSIPNVTSATSGVRLAPISLLTAIDRPAAGLYTYKIRVDVYGGTAVYVKYAKLLVYEELY